MFHERHQGSRPRLQALQTTARPRRWCRARPTSSASPVKIEKVTDYAAIAGYGIASTPGIVIDGKVVHAGGLPKAEDVARWLTN